VDAAALEEFKTYTGLMQFYLNLVLQTFSVAMTVTAGIVAYVTKGDGSPGKRGIALLLPAVLCGGLGLGFLFQTCAASELHDRVVDLAAKLGFGLAPHGQILVSALYGLGGLLLVTGLVLLFTAIFQIRRKRAV
jgi:hypothetical protein